MSAPAENIVLIRVLDSKAPYQIQLTVRDPSVFSGVMEDPRFQGKTDEQLLKALREAYKTEIYEIERYNAKGKCSDGPNGQPASQIFNEDGVMILQRRFRDGKLQDADNGEAAVMEYDGNRILRVTEHYQDGQISAGINGEASIINYAPNGDVQSQERFKNKLYHDSESGQPALVVRDHFMKATFVEHFVDGLLNDSITGEPASKKFDETGKLVGAERYNMGVEAGELNQEEIDAYNEALRQSLQGPKRPPSVPGPKP